MKPGYFLSICLSALVSQSASAAMQKVTIRLPTSEGYYSLPGNSTNLGNGSLTRYYGIRDLKKYSFDGNYLAVQRSGGTLLPSGTDVLDLSTGLLVKRALPSSPMGYLSPTTLFDATGSKLYGVASTGFNSDSPDRSEWVTAYDLATPELEPKAQQLTPALPGNFGRTSLCSPTTYHLASSTWARQVSVSMTHDPWAKVSRKSFVDHWSAGSWGPKPWEIPEPILCRSEMDRMVFFLPVSRVLRRFDHLPKGQFAHVQYPTAEAEFGKPGERVMLQAKSWDDSRLLISRTRETPVFEVVDVDQMKSYGEFQVPMPSKAKFNFRSASLPIAGDLVVIHYSIEIESPFSRTEYVSVFKADGTQVLTKEMTNQKVAPNWWVRIDLLSKDRVVVYSKFPSSTEDSVENVLWLGDLEDFRNF